MGLKSHGNLEVANAAARESFGELFAGVAPGPHQLFSESYSTGAERDELPFAAALATIRKWTGAKQSTSLEAFTQTIKLEKYEYTFDLPRMKVDYDTSGSIGKAISQAIAAARRDSDDLLVYDFLVSNSGESGAGFDGSNLIDTTHEIGESGTQSNKTTSALGFATYDAAYQAMQGFVGANGQPLGVAPTHLMCGPKLRKVALEIAGNAERILPVSTAGVEAAAAVVAAGTIPNVFRGDNLDVVIWDRLTGTQDDYWYLMDLSKPARPVLIKNERDYELIELTDMKDHPRFEMDKLQWSIEADKAFAAGAWPTVYAGIL